MVKQGQFAQVSAFKRSRNIKQNKKLQTNQTISETQLTEFMLVRYFLTKGNKEPEVVRETIQRFLMVWLDNGQKLESQKWSVTDLSQQTLTQIGNQVPWQFYAILSHEWPKLVRFLAKELPAIPLENKVIVYQVLEDLNDMITNQLAVNWFVLTYQEDPKRLARVSEQQIMAMIKSFIQDNQINWQNIKLVYATTRFEIPEDSDAVTQNWFEQLQNTII